MAVHRIPVDAAIEIGNLALYSSRSADGEVAFPPDIAGGTTIEPDDIVIVDEESRTLYKGIVVSTNHNMNSESVGPRMIGLEDVINSVPWAAVRRFYNVKDLPCVNADSTALTFRDFVDTEYQGTLLQTWFTAFILEGGIGDLLLPEIDTYNKGFFTILKEMLAPYPQLRWVVEYDGTEALYPAGVLRIYDAATGIHPVALQIGGASGVVTGYNVDKDASECAEFVRVYAYGKFTDRYEVVRPSWPAQSLIQRWFIGVESPVDPQDSIRIQNESDEFFLDLKVYADNAQWEDSASGGIFGGGSATGRNQMRLWTGGDIAYNVRTGEIRFLTPEDESDEGQWWWVNDTTGEVYPPDHFERSGPDNTTHIMLTPGVIRRPFAFKNNHVDPEAYIFAHYKTLAPECFKEYQTTHPIANFRLRELKAQDPDESDLVYAFTKEDDSIDGFRPWSQVDEDSETEEDTDAIDYTSFNETLFPNGTAEYVGPPGASSLIAGFKQPLGVPMKVYSRDDDGSITTTFDDGVFGVTIYMKRPRDYRTESDLESFQKLRRFWEDVQGDVSFEEGSNCVKFSERQLVAVPEWNDKPSKVYERVGLGVSVPVVTGTQDTDAHIKLISWPIMVRYTSWEDYYVERTTPVGLGRYANLMMRSALIYLDGINYDRAVLPPEPIVVFDNVSEPSGPFDQMVDMAEEYYGQFDWKGTVTVALTRGATTWEVPYYIGQRVTFTGEVSPDIAAFVGIVNKIDLSSMDRGIAVLHFGKQVPTRNPFAANKRLGIQPEIEGFSGTDPLSPAVERL